MPQYLFKHKITGEIRETFFRMNEDKIYKGDTNKDDNWERIFTAPNAATNTQIDAFNVKDFSAKTADKKETFGSMFDRSKEASEKRKQKLGVKIDPVKEKYWDKWSKDRGGKRKPPKSYLL